jgi:uncharacterized membrane protein YkoI
MKKRLISVLVLLGLLATPELALARVSPDQAAAVAQQSVAGRVLAVEKINASGREVFRVKLLTTNGEVKVILIDAETGQKL